MTADCVRCTRPMPDATYACSHCAARADGQLAEILDMLPAARDIATGQARHGSGGGSGKPGSRLPFDLSATAKLDAIQNELTTWVRHVVEERGPESVFAGLDRRTPSDPLAEACSALLGQMEWLRHRAEVDSVLTDVDAAVRVMRGLVRGPAAQVFLGPCGAPIILPAPPQEGCDCGHEGLDSWFHLKPCPVAATNQRAECDGDVYGRAGASTGRCKTCGAEYDQCERQEWLDDVRRSWLFTAKEIADAYPFNVKTIRSWYDRGLLVAHGEHEGTPLLKLGEVLDLAAGDAARREEARAARARRMAAKASGEEAA